MNDILGKFDQNLNDFKVKTSSNKSTSKTKNKKSSGNGTGYGGAQKMSNELSQKSRAKAHEYQNKEDISLQNSIVKLTDIFTRSDIAKSSQSLLISLQECEGLRWVLKYLLVNDSLLDIGSRADVYRSLFQLVKSMSVEPFAAPYLSYSPASDESSVCDMLNTLAQQAKTFLHLYQNHEQDGEEGDDVELSNALMMAFEITDTQSSVTEGCANSNQMGIVAVQSPKAVQSSSTETSVRKRKHDEIVDIVSEDLGNYLASLRPLKFEAISLCDLVESGVIGHSFIGKHAKQAQMYLQSSSGHAGVVGDARKRLARVACEMSGLSSSLPVELGSSIFVRCDESRMDVLKALIVGPEGTPYANGLFEFDILLPPAYPSVPPQVLLVTTGGGSVRFNPNLYNCGKVCLSLLGTWAGPGWDPKESTLLQVLVSIQSLILVPDPYFNEPGYAGSQGSPHGKTASESYNANIRLQATRFAILGQLQKPSPIFEDVIKRHFYYKRESLTKQLEEWRALHDLQPKHTHVQNGFHGGYVHPNNVKPGGANPFDDLMGDIELALIELMTEFESKDAKYSGGGGGGKRNNSSGSGSRDYNNKGDDFDMSVYDLSSDSHGHGVSSNSNTNSSSGGKGGVIDLLDDNEVIKAVESFSTAKGWSCPTCTYENGIQDDVCTMCGQGNEFIVSDSATSDITDTTGTKAVTQPIRSEVIEL